MYFINTLSLIWPFVPQRIWASDDLLRKSQTSLRALRGRPKYSAILQGHLLRASCVPCLGRTSSHHEERSNSKVEYLFFDDKVLVKFQTFNPSSHPLGWGSQRPPLHTGSRQCLVLVQRKSNPRRVCFFLNFFFFLISFVSRMQSRCPLDARDWYDTLLGRGPNLP